MMQDSTLNQADERPPASELPIAELGLSTRTRNVLTGAGFDTVKDLLDALQEGDQALTSVKGFGPKSLEALKQQLTHQGFSLPGESGPESPPDDVILEDVDPAPAPKVTWDASDAGPTPTLDALGGVLEQEMRELEALEMEQEQSGPAPTPAVDVPPPPPPPFPTPAPVQGPPPPSPKQAAAQKRQPPIPPPPGAGRMEKRLSFGQRLSATLAQPAERLRLGPWLYGLIGAAVILLLLSALLLNRLGIIGYEPLDAEQNAVSHPDGVTLRVDPDQFTEHLRVQIDTVPRLEFLEGSAGGALREAVQALPAHLTVKSPLYQFEVRGSTAEPVSIDVLIPNDAEPWEMLDLYTWTGETWRWVGGELHDEIAESEFVRATVTDLPSNLVVVQSGAAPPHVAASLKPDDAPVNTVAGVVDQINPTGLFLGVDGAFVGRVDGIPGASTGEEGSPAVIPYLRNWDPGATVNRGLLSDLLTIPTIQQEHIANLVQLCADEGFAGIAIDYRGVSFDQRDAFSAFIADLADGLHAEGLSLTVVVEPPLPADGGWDTGGYDWFRLGQGADVVQIPFPVDPTAYIEGGTVPRLLDWATDQIERYKIHMLISSLSAEQGGDEVNYLSLQQAVAPFGSVIVRSGTTRVEPGVAVEFGLAGPLRSITPLESAGTYRLEYGADDGSTHTIWLGTASNLANKLQWARQYHLGGIAVADLFDPGNGPGMLEAVAAYRTGSPIAASQPMRVVWTASSPETTVDQQTSPLTAPGYTWTVLAAPGEYTVQATVASFDHGSASIQVTEPGAEATEPITTTEEEEVTLDCLNARFVTDVTIPDYTTLNQGQAFVKTWRMENVGTCAWPANTVIVRVRSGLGGPQSAAVGPVAVGETVDVSIDLVAPTSAGEFNGVWALQTGELSIPGGQVTAVIRVSE